MGKILILKVLAILSLSVGSASAQGLQNDEDLNTKIIIFTDEFEEFLEQAWFIYEQGQDLEPKALEKQVETLKSTSNRIAAAYFEALDTEVRPEMERYLHQQYVQNLEIHHLFLFMGNSVFSRAAKLVDDKKSTNRKYRMWGTVGGSVLGLATGGAILYFKPNLIPNAVHATLLVVGLGAAGAGLGYGGAYLTHTFILPANPAVENAKDFLALYPSGKDFIDQLTDASTDLQLGLLDIEEALYGLTN